MTAICLLVGGDRERREGILSDMLASQTHHGDPVHALDDAYLSLAARTRNADCQYFEDGAVAVMVAGYLTGVETDGGLHKAGEVNSARWLAQLWLAKGTASLDLVDGDYSAVVLEKTSRRLYTIAGPTVVYPLFVARHHADRSMWVVGSEPKAVLRAAGLQAAMNKAALAQHLVFLGTLLDPTATPFLGVERVPAGELACWHLDDPGRMQRQTFWHPEDVVCRPGRSRQTLLKGLRSAIEESTLNALPAAGRTMLSLSGGMDSSSLWAMMRNASKRGDVAADQVKAYSFIYPGTPSDEQAYIDENHRFWGTIGCYRDIASEHIADSDEYLLSGLDYPLTGSNAYMLRLLAMDLASGDVNTLLGGFSGDAWLNIPVDYLADLLRQGEIAAAFRPIVGAWKKKRITARIALGVVAGVFFPRGSRGRRYLRPDKPPEWLADEYLYLMDAVQEWHQERVRQHGYARARMLYIRETGWRSCFSPLAMTQILAREGVSVRDPLGSRRVMEWSLSVPAPEIAGSPEKAFMREALHDLLPPMVLGKDFPTYHGGDPKRSHDHFRDLGDPGDWMLVQEGLVEASALRRRREAGVASYDSELERLVMTEAYCRRQFG